MRFIERLRQEKTAEAFRKQQQEEQLIHQREAVEKARLQAETIEKERHAQRRKQAECFREESGISLVAEELVKYLEAYEGGRRGSFRSTVVPPLGDPDSVYDRASWNIKHGKISRKSGGCYVHCSEKYIVIETCPDGDIVFHAGSSRQTTIQVMQWRSKEKGQLFDKALEKAYRNPGENKFSEWHPDPITHANG